jgi:DNA primase
LKLPQNKIEDVRAASDILSVVQSYVALKRRGQNWFGLCPFHHEDTASFSVNPSRQIFHCFGCGKGGNVFSFVMEMERVTFTEAVRMMAERSGIPMPAPTAGSDADESEAELLVRANGLARDFFHNHLVSDDSPGAQEARAYLSARGYGKDVIDRFLLGYAPDSWDMLSEYARSSGVPQFIYTQAGLLKEKESGGRPYDAFRHRIMFPIRNLAGRVIAFGGRRLREDEPAKYINSPETAVYRKGRELFGLWEARDLIRKRDEAILVEGYTDCLSLVMAGVGTAVASLGTALTENQARLLKRFAQRVFILYDGDTAGLNAARRAIDVLVAAGVAPKVIQLPPEEDPDSYVRKFGGDAIWSLCQSALSPVEFQLVLAQRSKTPLAEAARELMQTAAAMESPVDQDVLLREIAAKTGISLDALRDELSRTRSHTRGGERLAERPVWPLPGSITQLARVLIRRPELRELAFSRWTFGKIDDAQLRTLYKVLFDAWKKDDQRDPQTLLDHFPDPPLRDFVAECLYEDMGEIDAEKVLEIDRQVAEDCLKMMEADGLREELAGLKQKLAQSKDHAETAELMRTMQDLMKREKELRQSNRN